jgi:hypothetical protein
MFVCYRGFSDPLYPLYPLVPCLLERSALTGVICCCQAGNGRGEEDIYESSSTSFDEQGRHKGQLGDLDGWGNEIVLRIP